MGGEAVNGRSEEWKRRILELMRNRDREGGHGNSIQDLLSYSCNSLDHRSGFANPDRAGNGRAEYNKVSLFSPACVVDFIVGDMRVQLVLYSR